ncbi:response regulator transcription factor [Clostridium sp. LP20]|uniref:response regulator transcription factor n=1 Tax=Clostridium sp. LP20 TaxID=3418665 RepID=UPI003EE4F63C
MKEKDILIIDDDNDLAMIIKDALEDHGYKGEIANSVNNGYEALEKDKYKLIILDVNLPDETGFDFCKRIREESNIPIIFISARTSDTDKITGLDIGGDDFIPKPFSLSELLSRVNANIRRAYGFKKEEKFRFYNIEIDLDNRIVKKDGQVLSLSLKEFDLLKYFIQNRNKILKKATIFNEVWGIFSEIEISTLAVHVRWLREKLEEDSSNPKILKTVWGIGYTFEVPQ